MHLWLVRHAVAVEQGDFQGPDADRPLTEKGRRRFGEFCDWLTEQTEMPETILSSPLCRAAETAAILAKSADLKKSSVVSTDLLAPGVDLPLLLDFLAQQPGEIVALVGHEPDMSRCLSQLVGGGDFAFGKAFIAAVEFAGSAAIGAGRLHWLCGPKLRLAK
jgi:phosphohistidine phosphatase